MLIANRLTTTTLPQRDECSCLANTRTRTRTRTATSTATCTRPGPRSSCARACRIAAGRETATRPACTLCAFLCLALQRRAAARAPHTMSTPAGPRFSTRRRPGFAPPAPPLLSGAPRVPYGWVGFDPAYPRRAQGCTCTHAAPSERRVCPVGFALSRSRSRVCDSGFALLGLKARRRPHDTHRHRWGAGGPF